MDNHSKFMEYQRMSGEVAQALIDLRNQDITFSDFVSFCHSFNPDVTIEQIIDSLGDHNEQVDKQLGGKTRTRV